MAVNESQVTYMLADPYPDGAAMLAYAVNRMEQINRERPGFLEACYGAVGLAITRGSGLILYPSYREVRMVNAVTGIDMNTRFEYLSSNDQVPPLSTVTINGVVQGGLEKADDLLGENFPAILRVGDDRFGLEKAARALNRLNDHVTEMIIKPWSPINPSMAEADVIFRSSRPDRLNKRHPIAFVLTNQTKDLLLERLEEQRAMSVHMPQL